LFRCNVYFSLLLFFCCSYSALFLLTAAKCSAPSVLTPPGGKSSLCSITERRVQELIPVLGSQPAGYVSHKPGSRLQLLSARPAVTPATLKRAATNFAA